MTKHDTYELPIATTLRNPNNEITAVFRREAIDTLCVHPDDKKVEFFLRGGQVFTITFADMDAEAINKLVKTMEDKFFGLVIE